MPVARGPGLGCYTGQSGVRRTHAVLGDRDPASAMPSRDDVPAGTSLQRHFRSLLPGSEDATLD